MRAKSKDSLTTFCTIEGCGKPRRARMLCATHYNQQHQPNRHRKVEVTCDCCGGPALKEAGRGKRYEKLYCSDLCKTFDRFGPLSKPIPADHWARWYGASSAWTAPARYEIECAWCGDRKAYPHQRAAYCSRVCQKKHGKVKRKGRERGAVGAYTWMDITRMWQSFGGACAYCRQATPLSEIQAEHVVPLSKGGANNRTNLLPSCGACNSDKRDLDLHEWNTDRARRDLPPVTTEWMDDDPRYRHLTSVRTDVLTL